MNGRIIKTELYKICSKRVVWVSMGLFLALFLALHLQFLGKPGVQYTLQPVKAELSAALKDEALCGFIREGGYARTAAELLPRLPQSISDYIAQYQGSERVFRSLNASLASSLNSYVERADRRAAWLAQLAEEAAAGDGTALTAAKQRMLRQYRAAPTRLELNLEPGANALIDVNHAAVFPGLVMLVILVGLAGVYADEAASGVQPALLTSRRGRGCVFWCKACAAALFVAGVVVCMEGFALITAAFCYHWPDTSVTAASTYGLSLAACPGTVLGFCLRQAAGTLAAGLALGSLVLCLSAHSKSALAPFFAAGLYYGGTALYANQAAFPPYLSTLLSLPGEWSLFMLQTQVELISPPRCTSLFGLVLPALTANLLFQLAFTAACLALCYRGYTQKQVMA